MTRKPEDLYLIDWDSYNMNRLAKALGVTRQYLFICKQQGGMPIKWKRKLENILHEDYFKKGVV